MSLPNIFIIVTDSARAFDSGSGDDRERPQFYDSLTDFTYCPYAYCSAPSSVMSGAALLASKDAYMISRNYDDFRFGSGIGTSNLEALRNLGYDTHGFFVARELREKLGPLTGITGMSMQEYLKFSDRMWSNKDLNQVIDDFLTKKKDASAPLFSLIWNNIRHDADISRNLYDLVDILKDHNYWEDSIIFFLSDHGYPTADKGITPEGLKRDKKTHDLWMTEDNIRIPFYFKTPFDEASVIKERVSTLDIFPTILSVLGQQPDLSGTNAVSITSLNNNRIEELRNRFIRVDSRFIGQSDRKTALIRGNIKLVKDYDNGLDTFFQLFSHVEEKEVRVSGVVKDEFIEEYNIRESHAFRFQYLQKIKKMDGCEISHVVLYSGDDEMRMEIRDFFSLKENQLYSKIHNIWKLFSTKTLIVNSKSVFLRILMLFLPCKSLRIPNAEEQVVLRWSIYRYIRAIRLTLPYARREPRYVWIRIREFIK